MANDARLLPLEGVENFRDFGGYVGSGGARIASGRFWRSAHHGKATAADLARISDLGLTTVVDLRRPKEREAEPSLRPSGFVGNVVACDVGDLTEAPHVAFLRETDLTPQSAAAFFHGYYAKAPFEPRHLILFRQYFEALADLEGAVLIHCTAGKDRTGLLAALTHHVLGVHPDDAVADFMLTNAAVRIEARLPVVTASLAQSLGKTPSEAAVRAFLGVDSQYLTVAFDTIRANHGSVESYLEDLGVTSKVSERVREKFLN